MRTPKVVSGLLAASCLGLSLSAVPALADPAPAARKPERPHSLLRCLAIVDLTDQQKADIRALLESKKPVLSELVGALRGDRDALREAVTATPQDACAVGTAFLAVGEDLRAIRTEIDAIRDGIAALLTPEQRARYQGCIQAPRPPTGSSLLDDGDVAE